MMFIINQYLKFIWLLISKGKTRANHIDFNANRKESLKDLKTFVPASYFFSTPNSKSSFLKNLIGHAAFIKNSFVPIGGHLLEAKRHLSYIRIPKSASTSMSMAMLENTYPALQEKKITESQINFLTDANLQNSVEESTADVFFTVVRNPFARLVSVYHDFFETTESHYIYHDYLFGIIPEKLSFAEFINRISMIPDSLKDQHIKPQHCFLKYYEQKNIPVTVLKLEDTEKVQAFLSKHSLKLPHLNKSEKAYDFRQYYTSDTLQKVAALYQTDIQKFGYEHALQELDEHVKSREGFQKSVQK